MHATILPNITHVAFSHDITQDNPSHIVHASHRNPQARPISSSIVKKTNMT
jgi:folate-binding Fe-S cluster repair protein YgfZ